jgi:hypothetical protein
MAETKNPGRELAGSAGAEENSSDANPTGGSGQAAHPAVAFLRLLGKDPRQTYFRTLQRGTAPNDGRGGRDLLGFDLPALTRNNTSQAIYFITGNAIGASGINKRTGKPSGCVEDKDCPTVPALFVEWDDKPIEWQIGAWKVLGLPEPSVQADTGGKSIHNYWVLSEPMPAAEWQILQQRLLKHCKADTSISNASRLMRLPGFAYIDKATGKPNGRVVEVIQSSTTRYSPEQIGACLPPTAPAPGSSSKPPIKVKGKAGNLSPRDLQQIETAAQFIPERVVGGNTYEECRNALCGCAAALAAIGQPEEKALELLADKWPDRATAEEVLGSTTTRKAASFWAIAREHGYDLNHKRQQPESDDEDLEPDENSGDAAESHLLTGKARELLAAIDALHVCKKDPHPGSGGQDTRAIWWRVGAALNHTDEALLDDWIEWCRPLAEFNEQALRNSWPSYRRKQWQKGEPITIRTIERLAKSEPGKPKEATTTEEKLALLRQQASELLANRAPYAERLPILRAAAESFDITIRDAELQAMLTAARRARTGSDHAINPGEWLDVAPTPWIWDGIFMRGCLNLLVAMPKQGKTSLVLSYIAAHHRREPAFLDRTLPGACPPVLIVGTDQGANDWGRMLEQAGLAERQGDRVRITEPLVGLHHAGRPLHLDPEGIDSIAAHAQQHPGLLIVIDSLAACVAPLGLKEESAQIADPIHDLMEQVEPHDATVVLIHHASKGHAGEGASMASRGSTALPAVASQTIKLGSATAGGSDPRRLLSTEGRGGAPLSLVIQREGGSWDYIGTAESLQQEQAETDVQKSLNDRQADALELVRERWEDQMARTTAANLVEGLGITGKDPSVYALKTLKQLERKGFLLSIQSKAGERTGGRPPYEFWPKGVGEISSASRIRAGGLPQTPEETEETAITPLAPEDPHWTLSLFSSPGEVSSVSSLSSDHFEELGGAQETQEEAGKNLTSLPERHKAPSLAPWHPIALGIHAKHPDWHPHQIALHLGPGFERINGRDVKALLEARR